MAKHFSFTPIVFVYILVSFYTSQMIRSVIIEKENHKNLSYFFFYF